MHIAVPLLIGAVLAAACLRALARRVWSIARAEASLARRSRRNESVVDLAQEFPAWRDPRRRGESIRLAERELRRRDQDRRGR
jgi:hypothetical protein